MDITTLRTALIITLLLMVTYLLFRRFREHVRRRDLPVLQHAELLDLQVEYHPARLRVHLKMPGEQEIYTTILDARHNPLHRWEALVLSPGHHVLDQDLPEMVDGNYYLELRSATQRTVRQFRLQQV